MLKNNGDRREQRRNRNSFMFYPGENMKNDVAGEFASQLPSVAFVICGSPWLE